ncbi:esterase-like activity of phytase family protein [Aquimarina pacifica]|uniref:esterase-like activity of phytase family protein n=1 Tax=Aquimarina pacifica TaxID=1296415 RepID=UPI000470DF21|nr:esterase-like activity of phytase family protein [Aquimarina pacifica]
MILNNINCIFYLLLTLCFGCSSNNSDPETNPQNTDDETVVVVDQNTITSLEFIDEFIIEEQEIKGVPIGGLSGIDYQNNTWYLICDTSTPPIRFYKANLNYTKDGFTNVTIDDMIEIKSVAGTTFEKTPVDPESIRFDSSSGNILYTSEGSINNGIDPALIEISIQGDHIKNYTLPTNFKANSSDDTSGPRHNGVLEGLSISFDKKGYWVSFELPLIEDGPEPDITDTESPVRITKIDKTSGTPESQFAYELDPVSREPALGTEFKVNGLVEILEYDDQQFLALERSFSSGYIDGGNTVKIYKVDATNATNTLSIDTFVAATYTKATKTLLFDFDTIRKDLTNGTIDNLEGITFGPTLEDGSRTIVVISDNNFNSFFPQYNQIIALKVVP